MRLRLHDREAISFGVHHRRERDALTRPGFGSLGDLPARCGDRRARGFDVVDVEAQARVPLGRIRATMQRHGGAVLDELDPTRRLVADCEAEDSLVKGRSARDIRGREHEIRLRDLHRSPPLISGSACRNVVSSLTFAVAASGRIRLTSPVRTFPGPNSTKTDTLSPADRRTEANHCTGDHTCFSSSAGISRTFW